MRAAKQATFMHSCRCLLYGVLAFVGLQMALRAIIDYQVPELRDPAFEIKYRQLQQIIARAERPPEVVCMVGSSVTIGAFKARDVEDRLSQETGRSLVVANMANWAGGPLTELVWTRRMLERGLRPRLMLIECSLQMYHCDFPADSLRFPSYLLAGADLDVLERYGEEPDLRLNWWRTRVVPSYGHRLSILSHLAVSLVPRGDEIQTVHDRQNERFWLEERTPPRERFEYLRERFSRLPQENLSVARRPGEALAEMLDLLRRHDVPTVVVIAPRSPTYRERATPEGIANTIQRIAAISEKHGTGFVNAFRWLDDDIWFSDCVHITETGADLFTRRLTEEVIRPELASTRTGKGSVASR